MTDLAYVLRHLPREPDPRLLLGGDPADDAAVYRVTDDLALIQTVDFFTPIVDNPRSYGRIAAANSLSDVYAVGGTPLTALNVTAFPIGDLPVEILSEILQGGAETAAEAGVTIVGGHTIDDPEPKYGLSVIGTVRPDRMITAHGARPGDTLALTKPIGTGAISTAIKSGSAAPEHVAEAVLWMTTLNRGAAEAMLASGAHAATDVTGFGLLGHLSQMCEASGVSAEIAASAVPLLPGALSYVRQGQIPGGTQTNLEYLAGRAAMDSDLAEEWQYLLADPQTSGGLLVSIPSEAQEIFRRHAPSDTLAAVVGSIQAGPAGTVRILP